MSSQRGKGEEVQAPLGVRPLVGLALLEAVRDRDLPPETFEDEDLAYTMPRKFGLNRVIAVQIRQYQESVRSRRRMAEDELVDLIRLVTRRPDAEETFRMAGQRLGTSAGRASKWYRLIPERLRRRRAARQARRRIRNLFGRPLGPITRDPLALETRLDLLIRGDPGGEACVLLEELLGSVVRAYLTPTAEVRHVECMAGGAPHCRWEMAVGHRDGDTGARKGRTVEVLQDPASADESGAPEVDGSSRTLGRFWRTPGRGRKAKTDEGEMSHDER